MEGISQVRKKRKRNHKRNHRVLNPKRAIKLSDGSYKIVISHQAEAKPKIKWQLLKKISLKSKVAKGTNKSKARSKTKWPKYLFLLACLTCISVGWTGAKYVSDIYALTDTGRAAKFEYKILSTETNKANMSTPDGLGKYVLEFIWPTDLHANRFKMDSENDPLIVTYTISVENEVMTKLYIYKDYQGTGAGTPSESEWTALLENVDFSDVPSGAIIEGTGADRYLLLPPSASAQIFKCTVTLKHGTKTSRDDHYLNIYPTIVQVD